MKKLIATCAMTFAFAGTAWAQDEGEEEGGGDDMGGGMGDGMSGDDSGGGDTSGGGGDTGGGGDGTGGVLVRTEPEGDVFSFTKKGSARR